MGDRGPAPKPTELRMAEGDLSHRPQKTSGQKVLRGIPDRPQSMTPLARREWALVVKHVPAGLLGRADRAVLYCYAMAIAELQELEEVVRRGTEDGKPSYIVEINDGTQVALNPLIKRIDTLRQQSLLFARELGLTPAARSRITTPVDGEADLTNWREKRLQEIEAKIRSNPRLRNDPDAQRGAAV